LLLAAPLLVAPLLAGETDKNPFSGTMRKAADEGGVVSITVPERWTDKEKAGDVLIHVYAAGGGGHDILVVREQNQGDIDALRDRYLEYDSGRYPGNSVKKVGEPYFGYRMDVPDKQLVVLRAFATHGTYGIILSITSRLANYDQYHAAKLAWVASTLTVDGTRTGGFSENGSLSGSPARHWDASGRVSIVAPGGWKPIELEGDEILVVARRGKSTEPRLFVNRWIGADSASLAITKIAREWKANYKTARFERLDGEPPRMIVQGREGDWVDYFVASFDGKDGYTVRLTVRRGALDTLREAADEAAKSIAFLDAPYYEPTPPASDITQAYKKLLVLHARAEQVGAMDDVGKAYEAFLKSWGKHGIAYDRSGPPLHVVLCGADGFKEASSYLGAPPAAYDRARRCVAIAGSPGEKPEAWRGAVYAAFAEALLHRDLKAAPPPWFRRGLADCLRAAGATGEVDGEIPEYLGRLQQRVGTNLPEPIEAVCAWSENDFRTDQTLDKPAHAWGYVHLMLFGKGALPTDFKKWSKALAKARNTAPPFQPKKPGEARNELQEHVAKRWSAGD